MRLTNSLTFELYIIYNVCKTMVTAPLNYTKLSLNLDVAGLSIASHGV